MSTSALCRLMRNIFPERCQKLYLFVENNRRAAEFKWIVIRRILGNQRFRLDFIYSISVKHHDGMHFEVVHRDERIMC